MRVNQLRTSKDWENLSAGVSNMFSNIKRRTFEDLERGGDGSGHRIVNRAKYNVDDIINGLPVRISRIK